MTIARASKIDLNSTPYYHCMTRCVRCSYLCGQDALTGQDYNHRKALIVTRLKTLADVFAIKICAYAIMSNHYHLVLFVDEEQARAWDDNAIKERWAALFPQDARRFEMMTLPPAEAKLKLSLWKERLMSISWFMRCLNEWIARLSNQEDHCKGRFWEGRFKSQALLDDGALLSAMAYVDLNPIRAKMASTPEESEFTSIYERIKIASKHLKKISKPSAQQYNQAPQPQQLMPFSQGKKQKKSTPTLDFLFSDYLQLVDYTGRVLREDKRGAILKELQPILTRLNLKPQGWLTLVKELETKFFHAIGQSTTLIYFNQQYRTRAPRGINAAKACYLNAA